MNDCSNIKLSMCERTGPAIHRSLSLVREMKPYIGGESHIQAFEGQLNHTREELRYLPERHDTAASQNAEISGLFLPALEWSPEHKLQVVKKD